MKIGSSNHRSSAILDIITFLVDSGVRVLIYEPDIQDKEFQSCQIIQCLDQFKAATDVIMANRFFALDRFKRQIWGISTNF